MSLCHLCPHARPPVPSCGPTPCRILFLGEAPSYREDKLHIPFSGDTGSELTNVYLPLTGLPRSEVHIANARLCSELDYRNPTPAQAASCAAVHLSPLLAAVRPQIVVPMGAVACSLFGNINLPLEHSIPRPGSYGPFRFILFPLFHPSAGLHTTSYMIPLMAGFKALGDLIRQLDSGTFSYPTDAYPHLNYAVIRHRDEIAEYIGEEYYAGGEMEEERLILAEDTESLPDGEPDYGAPYCLTFSVRPGTGRLIYARDKALLEEYRLNVLHSLDPLQVFHNYLHDEKVFKQLGLPVSRSSSRFRDTMVLAYELCLGGGGDEENSESKAGRGSLSLKALAYRQLAMKMRSFKDTVYPHSMPRLLEYLEEARRLLAPGPKIDWCECGHRKELHQRRGHTQRHIGTCTAAGCLCRKCKLAKPGAMTQEEKIVSLLHRKTANLAEAIKKIPAQAEWEEEDGDGDGDTDAGSLEDWRNPDDVLDPWKRYRGWHPHDHALMEGLMGKPPRPSIADVPEPQLLAYAVRDADATGRLFRHLLKLKPWIFYD